MFSIIIPTFNRISKLKKALNSIYDQTYKNYEIIIIDNFSTDDTEKIVNKYKESKLKYFKFNNSGIIGKSRNIGIKNSNAPWIAFLDSDDEWYENKLSILENFIKKNPEYDVITNDEEIYYEETKKKKSNNFTTLC